MILKNHINVSGFENEELGFTYELVLKTQDKKYIEEKKSRTTESEKLKFMQKLPEGLQVSNFSKS